ncbi:MAG TPA: DUF6541 family protein, partial [Chloroflexota bacterium]|nr:DUF6541 family protein [Chloroflexota bacterium]
MDVRTLPAVARVEASRPLAIGLRPGAWGLQRRTWPAWLPGLALLLLLTLPAWGPLLHPGFSLWQVYDGNLHLRRALFLREMIAGGDWYPRWFPQQFGGYGYPTLNFYAPGLYYLTLALAAPLSLVRPNGALYVAMQGAAVLGALAVIGGIYFLAWRVWRQAPAAVVAGAIVAYAPYAVQGNLYISGGMPHVLGLGGLAFLLACLTGLWQEAVEKAPAGRWWWGVAVSTAAIFLTHNAVAVIGAVVAALWLGCLWLWRPAGRPLLLAGSAALYGALLAAFLWLPALVESAIVQIERHHRGNLHYRNHFLAWPGRHPEGVWGLQERGPWTVGAPLDLHLIYPHSMYGPVRLGLWQGVICLLALGALLYTLWRVRRGGAGAGMGVGVGAGGRRLGILVTATGLLLALGLYVQSFDWFLPLWERYPLVRSIQLPSRLLGPAVFGVAVAGAGALALTLGGGARGGLGAAVVVAVLALGGTLGRTVPMDPQLTRDVGLERAARDEQAQPGLTDSMDEFLPLTANFETWHEGEARGFWLYERLWP